MDERGWHPPVERHGLSRVYPPDDYADMQRRGLLFVLLLRKRAYLRWLLLRQKKMEEIVIYLLT